MSFDLTLLKKHLHDAGNRLTIVAGKLRKIAKSSPELKEDSMLAITAAQTEVDRLGQLLVAMREEVERAGKLPVTIDVGQEALDAALALLWRYRRGEIHQEQVEKEMFEEFFEVLSLVVAAYQKIGKGA